MNQVAENVTNKAQPIAKKGLSLVKPKRISLTIINSIIWVLVFFSVLNFVAQSHPIKRPNLPKLIAAFSLAFTSGYVTTMPIRRLKAKITEAK